MVTLRVDTTPNPNCIKVTLDRPVVESGSVSAASPEEAEGCGIAKKLFGMGGITNVFLINNFISVTKDPAADWGTLVPGIEEAIRSHYGG